MKTSDELVLYPSKSKHLALLAVSILFTAGGIWLGVEGKRVGFLCAAFFGLGIPIFIIQILPNASFLKLQNEGFEFSTMYRRHFVKWSDIEEFGIMTQRHSGMTTNKIVGWNYKSGFNENSKSRNLSQRLTGIQAGLPDTYGLKAEKLLGLMTDCWSKQTYPPPTSSSNT